MKTVKVTVSGRSTKKSEDLVTLMMLMAVHYPEEFVEIAKMINSMVSELREKKLTLGELFSIDGGKK